MPDPRLEAYAELLAERCLQIGAGDQVLVTTSPLALPLVEQLAWSVARRGGHLIPLVQSSTMIRAAVEGLPEEQLGILAPALEQTFMTCDAVIGIDAPENTRALGNLDPTRMARRQQAQARVLARLTQGEVRWTTCNYPTQALAQEADMSLQDYEEFVYGACLIDWDATTTRMEQIKACFDGAQEVHIRGPETDLRLSLRGRAGVVDDGRNNMPGGEVFYAPVETSAEGFITYEYPAIYHGREVEGVRLEFRNGQVVRATARKGEDFLHKMLETDAGARRVGELGIGCNPGIQRFTRSTLFDEKIEGTLHLALGRSYGPCGGENESNIHWDMVKEMRQGGEIWVDGRRVYADGRYLDLA